MKIGLCAARFRNNDLAYNQSKLLSALEERGAACDLLCFGEAFLQGFDALSWNPAQDYDVALRRDHPAIQEIAAKAQARHCAVAFGYLERDGTAIYSSYLVVSADGEVLHNFHRVSPGWKVPGADPKVYREGTGFNVFTYQGKRFASALCGDLWQDDGNLQAVSTLAPDFVLWPVYVDFTAQRWASEERVAYAARVATIPAPVLLVNSVCRESIACGGTAVFHRGEILAETPMGGESILIWNSDMNA